MNLLFDPSTTWTENASQLSLSIQKLCQVAQLDNWPEQIESDKMPPAITGGRLLIAF